MTDLIPIHEVIEINPRVQELGEQGFIIYPDKIDDYLTDFKNRKTTLPNKDYWNEKRVLITLKDRSLDLRVICLNKTTTRYPFFLKAH